MPAEPSGNPVPASSGGEAVQGFPATRWSLIHRVQEQDGPERHDAMESLCRAYWKPVYLWLRARGSTQEDAEDITQDFFVRLLAGDWFAGVSEEKGRLRSFLLVILKRHAANTWEHRQAKKRGGGCVLVPIDAGEAENTLSQLLQGGCPPDVIYARQWALQMLEEVMESLRRIYASAGKEKIFNELRDYLTGGAEDEGYAESAGRLGMSTGAVKVAAYRLRERYRAQLRMEILKTVTSESEVDDEIAWLHQVFVRSGEPV